MPDGLTFRVANEKQLKKWFGDWYQQVMQSRPLMAAVATFNLQQIFKTFRTQGARDGMRPWREFSTYTLHPVYYLADETPKIAINTWNIRYGTDMKGKTPRRKRGANVRRYSPSSKLLQASGGFRNSFRNILLSRQRSIVGSTMKNAAEIIGDRPVIRVSSRDKSHFQRLLIEHMLPEPMVGGPT